MYSTNPKLPRLRAQAVEMIHQGKGIREVARYFGYSAGAVSKWCKKVAKTGVFLVPTKSWRPHFHPKESSEILRKRIIELRLETKRCAEVIHQMLINENKYTSLSTVKRILDRTGLLKKKSKWKKYRKNITRPDVQKPGDLVQIDTIHMQYPGSYEKIYVYTILDVFSRWAYAWATPRISAGISVKFMKKSLENFPFLLECLQSDNGSEFSNHFTQTMKFMGYPHRHSRVRKPNDNGHLERFNRTVQEECLYKLPHSIKKYNQELNKYLEFYNTKRLHLGIKLKSPLEHLKCFQAID
jgi:transposase InsO family protein